MGVWFGARDRLINRRRERRFFGRTVAEHADSTLHILDSGHVVLPAAAVTAARAEITTWLRAAGAAEHSSAAEPARP